MVLPPKVILGCGPLPVLQTFRGKSRSPGVADREEERVIVPTGRLN